ncbi:MAG: 4-alpha-glucanotransferase, partial [Acidobacteriota bacterium]
EGDVAGARAGRLTEKHALIGALNDVGAARATIEPAAPHSPEITSAIHRYISASPSMLVLIQADDLAGEIEPLNLPGTDRERPNWRRKIGVESAALWQTPVGKQAVADFAPSRSAGTDESLVDARRSDS